MSPTCSRAAIRLVATILLVSSIANAAVLPHQLLDPRAPLTNAEESALNAAVTAKKEDDPENFFESISKLLNNNSGWVIFRDFWARLFGPRDDDGEDAEETTTTTTVFVTATPSPVDASATPASEVSPSTTPEPTDGVFTILPVGDISTAINVSLSGSVVFSTDDSLPTAVPITDEFSVTIPTELLTTIPASKTANSSAPLGTGSALAPYGNGSDASTTTFQRVSTVIVTATVTPVLVTGTDPVGTGAPISIAETPKWSNSSYAPTKLPGTGYGPASVGTSLPFSEIPLYPNATAEVTITVEGASATTIPVIVTGIPESNVTIAAPTGPYANKTTEVLPLPTSEEASPSVGTELPAAISETPYYTNASEIISATALPLSGYGAPASPAGTATRVASFSEIPTYSNTTTIETATAVVVLPPVETTADVIVEFPGEFNYTWSKPTGGYGKA